MPSVQTGVSLQVKQVGLPVCRCHNPWYFVSCDRTTATSSVWNVAGCTSLRICHNWQSMAKYMAPTYPVECSLYVGPHVHVGIDVDTKGTNWCHQVNHDAHRRYWQTTTVRLSSSCISSVGDSLFSLHMLNLISAAWIFDHITPLPEELYLLKMPKRIPFCQWMPVHRCLHGTAPTYQVECMLHPRYCTYIPGWVYAASTVLHLYTWLSICCNPS